MTGNFKEDLHIFWNFTKVIQTVPINFVALPKIAEKFRKSPILPRQIRQVVKSAGWGTSQSERSISNLDQSESRIWPTWQAWPGWFFRRLGPSLNIGSRPARPTWERGRVGSRPARPTWDRGRPKVTSSKTGSDHRHRIYRKKQLFYWHRSTFRAWWWRGMKIRGVRKIFWMNGWSPEPWETNVSDGDFVGVVGILEEITLEDHGYALES